MTLLTLYVLCATAGAVLLGTSIFFGGGDGDHDHDGHADLDGHVDADVDLDADADVDVDGHGELGGIVDAALHGDLQGALHGAADAVVGMAGAEIEGRIADVGHHVEAQGFEWSVLPFGSIRFWTFLLECFGLTGTLLSLAGVPAGTTLGLSIGSGTVLGWGAFQFFRWLAHEQVSGATNLHDYRESEARVLLRIPVGGIGKIAIESNSGRVELVARTLDKEEIPRGATVLVIGVKQGEAQVTALTPSRQLDAAKRAQPRAIDEV